MACRSLGPRRWRGERDAEGHRTYKIVYLLKCDSPNDGPVSALLASGLPSYGQQWIIGNDIDLWSWMRWDTVLTPLITNEGNFFLEG